MYKWHLEDEIVFWMKDLEEEFNQWWKQYENILGVETFANENVQEWKHLVGEKCPRDEHVSELGTMLKRHFKKQLYQARQFYQRMQFYHCPNLLPH